MCFVAIPRFTYQQTPLFLLYPLSLLFLSGLSLFQSSGAEPLSAPTTWGLQWIAVATPWLLIGISTLWLLGMLLGKEYTFQKIESDGKILSFQTNRYQGKVAVEEIAKCWMSDQRDWVVLYFLFQTSQVAERLHLKPKEIEENLQDFFAQHILGLPKRAFPRDFQRANYPPPEDILVTQEEGIQNWMNYFRTVLLGFMLLYAVAVPWKPEAFPYFILLALGIFWFALRAYPLVRVKKWGFFKKEPEKLIFFQTSPLFSVSRQTPYEQEKTPTGSIHTQIEPDRVQWLQPRLKIAPIAQQYLLTSASWTPDEFSRFQACFSEQKPETGAFSL